MTFLHAFLITYVLGALNMWLCLDPDDEDTVRMRPYLSIGWPLVTLMRLWDELIE